MFLKRDENLPERGLEVKRMELRRDIKEVKNGRGSGDNRRVHTAYDDDILAI